MEVNVVYIAKLIHATKARFLKTYIYMNNFVVDKLASFACYNPHFFLKTKDVYN